MNSYQEEDIEKTHCPQMNAIAKNRWLRSSIYLCKHESTHENGIGVVRIRSKPDNESTNWFSPSNKVSKSMVKCHPMRT